MWEKLYVNMEWYALRMLLAAFCGAVLGYTGRSERRDSTIGIYVLVALGAALFEIIGEFAYRYIDDNIYECTLFFACILAAGAVFANRQRKDGLALAVGIWLSASIGISAGTGNYGLAMLSTMLIAVLQIAMRHLVFPKEQKRWQMDVLLRPETDAQSLRDALAQIPGMTVEEYHITRYEDGGRLVKCACAVPRTMAMEDALQLMENCGEVMEIKG